MVPDLYAYSYTYSDIHMHVIVNQECVALYIYIVISFLNTVGQKFSLVHYKINAQSVP